MGFFDKLFGKKDRSDQENKSPEVSPKNNIDIEYQNKILATKQFYPFNSWRESYSEGLTQYTTENCNKIEKVFDDLIAALDKIGKNANEEQKKELFKKAIHRLTYLF